MNTITKTEVIKRAIEVFSDEDKGLLWLNTYNATLGDIPITMLNSKDGVQALMDALGRIEHGVFI